MVTLPEAPTIYADTPQAHAARAAGKRRLREALPGSALASFGLFEHQGPVRRTPETPLARYFEHDRAAIEAGHRLPHVHALRGQDFLALVRDFARDSVGSAARPTRDADRRRITLATADLFVAAGGSSEYAVWFCWQAYDLLSDTRLMCRPLDREHDAKGKPVDGALGLYNEADRNREYDGRCWTIAFRAVQTLEDCAHAASQRKDAQEPGEAGGLREGVRRQRKHHREVARRRVARAPVRPGRVVLGG